VLVALGLILLGALLVYAGIKGESVRALLQGQSGVKSKAPAKVQR